MPRQPRNGQAQDDVLDQFLTGRFLGTMRLYADMAGTSNPAIDAADRLRAGEAATIPGEWLGPGYFGVMVRLQAGVAPEVIG